MSKTIKIIAEIGKNFIDTEEELTPEQYLDKAKILVQQAKESGADIVKFQCHVFQDEQHKRSPSRYEWIERNEQATPLGRFWIPLQEYCQDNDIEFLCTPMSQLSAQKINPLVSMWKIGSADITDLRLLTYIANTGKPIIISSGMSTLGQIDEALELIQTIHLDNLIQPKVTLMHCVSLYPCPIESSNLATIALFKKRYPSLRIGYSSHTLSHLDALGAVFMGASVIEKHFTLDRGAFGPDHKVSLLPHEFKDMVDNIRQAETIIGQEEKILLKEEQGYWTNFRKI